MSLKKFENQQLFEEYKLSSEYKEPNVSLVSNTVVYNGICPNNVLSYDLNYGEQLNAFVNVEQYKATPILVKIKPGATFNLSANFGERQPFGTLKVYLERFGGGNVDTVIINGIEVPLEASFVEMNNPNSLSSYKYTLIE